MSYAREITYFLCYVVISPEAEIHRHILVHSDTLRHVLIIFGRNEEEDQ